MFAPSALAGEARRLVQTRHDNPRTPHQNARNEHMRAASAKPKRQDVPTVRILLVPNVELSARVGTVGRMRARADAETRKARALIARLRKELPLSQLVASRLLVTSLCAFHSLPSPRHGYIFGCMRTLYIGYTV